MEDKEIIVHQIWLGREMPEEAKKLVEKAYKACGKAKYEHKLWHMDDILAAFPNDYAYYFWKRLFNTIPLAPVMAAAADYYKWKILASTPEDQCAMYIDVDVEMVRKPRAKYALPKATSDIAFGSMEQPGTPGVSCIQVIGPKAASVALNLADARLKSFGMDSNHFLTDVIKAFGNGKRNSRVSLGAEWLQEEVIPAYVEVGVSAEVFPQDVYCYYGQEAKPLMLHKAMHLATEGSATEDQIESYYNAQVSNVQTIAEAYNKQKKRVVVLMSSAREYENLDRTLGIISARDIRNVQRGTTFENLSDQIDYYFVVGGEAATDGYIDDQSPDIYYSGEPEGKEYQAKRFYSAMKWVIQNGAPENIFFCEDDNYIHTGRLLSYCNVKAPDDLVGTGCISTGHPCVKGGLFVSAALARKIVLEDLDAPKHNEDFGAWLNTCIELVGGQFEHEYKFSDNKGQYPAPTNARITTHECNPYDLVALHRLNKG